MEIKPGNLISVEIIVNLQCQDRRSGTDDLGPTKPSRAETMSNDVGVTCRDRYSKTCSRPMGLYLPKQTLESILSRVGRHRPCAGSATPTSGHEPVKGLVASWRGYGSDRPRSRYRENPYTDFQTPLGVDQICIQFADNSPLGVVPR